MVSRDLLAPPVDPAVPGPRVPGLELADHQAVRGCVQPDPGWMYKRRCTKFWGVNSHSRIFDC